MATETCANYIVGEDLYFSSDERRWITKLHKLKNDRPEDVAILKEPENNDGVIYAKLPAAWLKLVPKRIVEMTEEQRMAISERMRQMRERKDDDAADT